MKRILLALTVLLLFTLVGCKSSVREIPIKDTIIYCDCSRYDTIPDYDILNDEPDYVVCTNRYTNLEETITWDDYLKSDDLNAFMKDVLDDIDDRFMFLENNDLEQILYDILVVEYATKSCTREELNDYLWDYENEINIDSERIVTLLDMIEQQLDGE